MARPRRPLARCRRLLAVACLLAPALARADLGGTVSLQSDARDRGLSYSRERPQAQASLAWDGSSGWYAGAQLSRARFVYDEGAWLQAYAGRVLGLAEGLDAEGGLLSHHFDGVSRYDFSEAYVGLLGERWSLRLYATPDYFGSHQPSLYAQLGGRRPLGAAWSLFGSLGALWGHPSLAYDDRRPLRLDARAGLAWQPGSWSLQLSAVTASEGGPTTWTRTPHRSRLVLGLSAAF